MSQHDYAIADQNGLAFLADLNDSLAAIVSQNSGATAPATTFAYQFWADTTTGILKQRNAANSAWISLYTLAGGPLDKAGGTLTGGLNEARGSVAMHATTMDLWAQPNIIDGTSAAVTVTAIANAPQAGARRVLYPVAASVITNGATFAVDGAGNHTATAGDKWEFEAITTSTYKVHVTKKDGTAVVSSGSGGKVQDFRLTLTTAVPVTTADVTAATSIFCTPYKGNQISLYDGSATWNTRSSAQFSLALGTLTSAIPYDVFCYDNAGTPTLEFLVWTNDTTRATALAYQDGVLVKSGATTRRYLGTFYTTATTTTEDSAAKRYLWNYYNRVFRAMRAYEATSSWSYTLAVYRQANAATTNQLNFICGVAEDGVSAQLSTLAISNVGLNVNSAIGLDSTTAVAADSSFCRSYAANSLIEQQTATYSGVPGVGRHYLSWLEYSDASGTTTWYSTGAARSGLSGSILA